MSTQYGNKWRTSVVIGFLSPSSHNALGRCKIHSRKTCCSSSGEVRVTRKKPRYERSHWSYFLSAIIEAWSQKWIPTNANRPANSVAAFFTPLVEPDLTACRRIAWITSVECTLRSGVFNNHHNVGSKAMNACGVRTWPNGLKTLCEPGTVVPWRHCTTYSRTISACLSPDIFTNPFDFLFWEILSFLFFNEGGLSSPISSSSLRRLKDCNEYNSQ